MSEVVGFAKKRGKTDEIPKELHDRCLDIRKWYIALAEADATARKAGPLPKLDKHVSRLLRCKDEAARLLSRALAAHQPTSALQDYHHKFLLAVNALSEVIAETGKAPRQRRKEATTLFFLRVALEWKKYGLNPASGREGIEGFRDTQFQCYLWELSQTFPGELRPNDRPAFADSVESALRNLQPGKMSK